MHISCVICSDLFTPTTEVFVTRCGHLFHQICIQSWIQRQQSCPHCRNVVTEATIQRVYFNISSDDSRVEDVGALINKVESLELQHNIDKKDIDRSKEKIKKLYERIRGLRMMIEKLKHMKESLKKDSSVKSESSLNHTRSSRTPERNASQIPPMSSRGKKLVRLAAESFERKNTTKVPNNASSSKQQSPVELTDSPYVPVKSNPLMVDYSSFLDTKYQTNVTSPKEYSIFKPQQTKAHQTSRNKDVAYNGLEGSSKEDYPSLKPNPTGIKRIKSETITSNKMRKLAPLTEKKT